VDEERCTRILKMAMTHNIFHEPSRGFVSHTAGSKLLLVSNMRDSVWYVMEEGSMSACRISEAAEKFGGSQERNAAVWNMVHGAHQPIFQFFGTEPVRMKRFLGHTDNIEGVEGYNLNPLTNGYDWISVGEGDRG
jgi:6-hydroxytryprostatin B O-methyltransferase